MPCRLCDSSECGNVLARRSPEPSAVFATELGRAFVANAERCFSSITPRAQHEPAGLLKPQLFLVLQRGQGRDALEVRVKCRRAHSRVLRESVDAERVSKVLLQPPNCLRDPMGRAARRDDLTESRPMRAVEYAVCDTHI